jgi:7-cyano-7-deazaguanine reductase
LPDEYFFFGLKFHGFSCISARMEDLKHTPQNSSLGKSTVYIHEYNPGLLYPIPRNRRPLFFGADLWNAYEFSWLNTKGKPMVALLQLSFPVISTNLIESKSLKLYLNSFAQTAFDSTEDLLAVLTKDLSSCADAFVKVELVSHKHYQGSLITALSGLCLDDLDIKITQYNTPAVSMLEFVSELGPGSNNSVGLYYSHLLKSNCPVTGQPDWASIGFYIEGPRMVTQESLLRYIIAYREVTEFHEHCIEQIFGDLKEFLNPTVLHVDARYVRRGGLDINPYRSTQPDFEPNFCERLIRQ